MFPFFIPTSVAILGLITGSFLNAVIHRLPRGISLLDPKRSFCPSCEKMIPWYENLPVVSWVLLRGRCSGCALPIAIRYPLVELLTGGLYLLTWESFGLPMAPVFWIFLSLLIAATFIDFDHLMIPDEITLGGTAAGLICATIVPRLLGETLWWKGFLWSALGAGFGYFLLWGVVELGKKAFGKRRIRCDEQISLELFGNEIDVFLKFGEETMPLSEFFYRERDRVEADCHWLEITGERLGPGKLLIEQERVIYQEKEMALREWPFSLLPDDTALRAEVSGLTLPREAMGFGDVKFLACIGAFLGWKGVLFALFGGSVIGAVIGIATLLITRGRSGGRIPFGPYLALGALLWLFCGPELLAHYFARFHGEAFFLSSLLQIS
jgi:leader peptidase (prepilin peptidase)/N-methyltransferase